MKTLINFSTKSSLSCEADVETHAITVLNTAGYDITQRKCKDAKLNKHWPSKSKKATGKGFPDVLLYLPGSSRPVCVWENKGPAESALDGLLEARFYIEGLRKALPSEPFLPRIAAGYNGKQLLLSYYTNDSKWVPIKENGVEVIDQFPIAQYLINGITAQGVFSAVNGSATANDLNNLLPKLKTAYRIIPVLASGRTPIDFTIALLTLRMLVELNPVWGTWSEQPRFAAGSKSDDHGIGERLEVLANRILGEPALRSRYGDIFEFHEKSDTLEIAFNFIEVLSKIEKGAGHFDNIFGLVDSLPPLEGADFDIFGEVYQSIGDEATKKALGEFFTGRHIISSIIPVLFCRAGFVNPSRQSETKSLRTWLVEQVAS
jgi:type I restriction enzyme M protein